MLSSMMISMPSQLFIAIDDRDEDRGRPDDGGGSSISMALVDLDVKQILEEVDTLGRG
jgi:hypothetical protein